MVRETSVKLKIPRQDLEEFTLFRLDADAANTWASGLPVTNTKAAAQQLRLAISHLNGTKVAPEVRYSILEMLRPNLDVALSNLSKRFLNQPLIMPEEPRQMAELADSLYSITRIGYTIVAIEAIQQRESILETNPARLTCEAVQRALMFAGRNMLQTFQLYRPIELHGWLVLHQLYALADSQQLADLPVAEPLSGGSTIKATYLQALMLGCCKPNQLLQSDLAALYRGLQEWGSLLRLESTDSAKGLFLVDLNSDQPPLYSSLYGETPEATQIRHIDTGPLIEHLETLRDSNSGQDVKFDNNSSMPSSMLEHLIASLGNVSLRNFNRTNSSELLMVCVGLSSCHYHVAGERSFEKLLHGNNYVPSAPDRLPTNPFLLPREEKDVWLKANPGKDYFKEEAGEKIGTINEIEHQVELDDATRAELLLEEDTQLLPRKRYPVYQVNLADASPGGYCLEWSAELPGDIRTGDIVSLKEQQSKEWAIAVIRWVSRLKNTRTLIGLELLSPRAMPYGASIQKKTGEKTPPMRVLLLPEIKLVGQPHTLITPRVGFRDGQKITLINGPEVHSIQLLRQISSTGSFAQFDFRYIKQLGDVLAEDKSGHPDSSYDSLWSKL